MKNVIILQGTLDFLEKRLYILHPDLSSNIRRILFIHNSPQKLFSHAIQQQLKL